MPRELEEPHKPREPKESTSAEEAKRDSLGLTVEDWILALLAYGKGVVRGKTRLQKALFLIDRLEEAYPGVDFVPARYEPREYGPFSRDVAKALENLRKQGLVEFEYQDSGLEEPITIIKASEEALRRGKEVLSRLKRTGAWGDIKARMDFALRVPLLELLWFVYDMWPEYTENSVLKRRLRFWRKRKLKKLYPEKSYTY